MQLIFKEDPNAGGKSSADYATLLASIGFKTSKATFATDIAGCQGTSTSPTASTYACGTFYGYTTSATESCSSGTVAATSSIAYAEAYDKNQVPNKTEAGADTADAWGKACMDKGFNMHHVVK